MKAGFKVSHRKIKHMGPRDRKTLNNLVLGKFVTVKKEYRARIRAGIHNLSCERVPARDLGAYVESLKGNINYLRLFDAKRATGLELQLRRACKGLEDEASHKKQALDREAQPASLALSFTAPDAP